VDLTKNFRAVLLSSIVLGGSSLANTASAETLASALSSAYQGNPTIRVERARLRGVDEQVPQALSGWRPIVSSTASVAHTWADSNVSKANDFSPENVSISLNQPLFRGFKTVESTKVAEANVRSERQQLLAVEQSILFNAVQAYANVLRDRQIVVLRRKNVGFLQKQLDASNARFKAGELTKTDVSQARSSLSGAKASLAVADANRLASEANYLAVIGKRPGSLKSPPLAKGPSSLESALSTAQETNPNILAAAEVEDASVHNVEVIKGDLLPTLSLQGVYNYNRNPQANVNWSEQATVEGVLSVPIYEGGRVYSQVRQAKQVASQNRIQVISAVRTVRENVANAWNNLTATGLSLVSVNDQLRAAYEALSGVQQEFQVGSRTTIDVLNAQQTVLNAQIAQVTAQRDQVVASYQLQSALGHLTARHLGIGGRYDPKQHYNEVRGKWIGLSAETVE
jgi:outer membrane protein